MTRFFQAHGAAIRCLEFEGGWSATVSDATGLCTLAHTAWLVCALPYTANLQSFTLRGPFDCAGMALLARSRRLEHLHLVVPDDRGLQHLTRLSHTLRSLYLDVDMQTTSLQAVSALTALTWLRILHADDSFVDCLRLLTALRSLEMWEIASDDVTADMFLPSSLTFLQMGAEDVLPVPATLGQCVDLRKLDLNADLDDSHETLEQLSTCTYLRSLSVRFGHLGLTFPAPVLRLTALRLLDLSFCWSGEATVCLPDSISALEHLRLLGLYDDQVEGVEVDSTITALTRLDVITLGDVEHIAVRSHSPGDDEHRLEARPAASPAGRVYWSFSSP